MTLELSGECLFCKKELASKENAKGWDWFTGRLKQTVHFCPQCLKRFPKAYKHIAQAAGLPLREYNQNW